MSELLQKLRNRRFQMKKDSSIKCVVETNTGARFNLIIDNVSISGIGATIDGDISVEEGWTIGNILPAAKISFDKHEYALGRMVVRTFTKADGQTLVGISTVDSRVPIDGPMSHYIDGELGDDRASFEMELSSDKFSLANFRENNEQNVDLFSKVQKYGVFFKDWEKSDRYGNRNVRMPSMGPRVQLRKKRKGSTRNDYLIMGSNDYLGLASHPEVMQAAKEAIDKYGFGSTGSPLTTGITDLHEELSQFIAQIYQKEKVILFNSGYAANVGTISGLVQAQDLVIADMIAHASIQDGMALARGTSRFYKHNNVEHLDATLTAQRKDFCGSLIITEGVFSMDGDVAPLDKIVKLARKHKSRILVDEAHSFGIIGPNGIGGCEKFDVLKEVDIVMGTFSKIGGGIGGFIATQGDVADWLYWLARSHMFSVSLPPSTAAAALKALQVFKRDRTLLDQIKRNIQHFASGLRGLGFDISPNHESAVLPAVIGDQEKLGIMNKHLMEAGVFVVPVPYPAVSRTKIRFRFTVMANHTIGDLDFALTVLESAMREADFKPQTQETSSDKPSDKQKVA